MTDFNSKMSILKYPIFCRYYNFFSANVSDITGISLVKIKNFEASYLYKKLSYTNTFCKRPICFEALYNILEYEKISDTFFFKPFF